MATLVNSQLVCLLPVGIFGCFEVPGPYKIYTCHYDRFPVNSRICTKSTKNRNYTKNPCNFFDLQSLYVSDSCSVPEKARHVIKHCNDFYSFGEEDIAPFNLPGWRPFSGSADWANFSDLCPTPWNYVSQEKLQNSPSWGFFGLYDGGGYVADLGYSSDIAKPVISNLRKYGWIDRQTRAVLLEFNIYNANTGYLSISTLYYEILPTGYGNPFARTDTFTLTSTQTGFYQFYLICQLLFIIIAVLFFLRESYKMYLMKCSYFRDAWNWIEILQIAISLLVVIFYVVKSKLVVKNALKVKENPYIPVSFQDSVKWNDAENGVLAIAVFIATVKLIRMIRFNSHVSMLMSSFRESRRLLLSYSVIFFIIFLAYAQLGRLVMGSHMQQYSSFQDTLFSEFLMCLGGKMGLRDLLRVNRVLGPLFGFSFILLNAFIFVNFFVAILNDSYEEVKDNTDKQSKDFEMADFILERLRELLGFGNRQRENTTEDGHKSKHENAAQSVDNKDENEHGQLELQEPNEKPNISFSTLAFQSNRLRRRARRIQLRDSKLLQKNAKNQKVTFKEEKCDGEESMKNLVVLTISALDCLYQEHGLERLDLLTSNLARDHVREDIELLSVIRLLRMYRREGTQSTISETDSTLVDVEISSFIASSPSPVSTISACAEDGRSSTSGDISDDETLVLLRSRASNRPLPQHLRGKELQNQLRSTVVANKSKTEKRKAPDSVIFKYYSFV